MLNLTPLSEDEATAKYHSDVDSARMFEFCDALANSGAGRVRPIDVYIDLMCRGIKVFVVGQQFHLIPVVTSFGMPVAITTEELFVVTNHFHHERGLSPWLVRNFETMDGWEWHQH